jgi:hypothetical protein
MKLTAITIVALLCSSAAFADSVADLQSGPNVGFVNNGGTYQYKDFNTNLNPGIDATKQLVSVKPAGSLNASLDFASMFPSFSISTSLLLTGANQGAGSLKWTVTAPSLIGSIVGISIPNSLKIFTVTGVSGQLLFQATRAAQPFAFNDGTFRDTFLTPVAGSYISIVGTVNNAPASLVIYPNIQGYGGKTGDQRVTVIYIPVPGIAVSNTSVMATIKVANLVTGSPLVIPLSTSGPLHAPSQVSIPVGAASAQVQLTCDKVGEYSDAYLTATTNGFSVVSYIPVNPMVSIIIPFVGYKSGQVVQAIVKLAYPAPAGGANVALHCDDLNAIMPAMVTVPQGALQAVFYIQTGISPKVGPLYVMATYDGTMSYAQLLEN